MGIINKKPDGKVAEILAEGAKDTIFNPIRNVLNPTSEVVGKDSAFFLDSLFNKSKFNRQIVKVTHDIALENFKQKLSEKINKIPPELIESPDYHTMMLAFEDADSCITEEELCEMFSNLIVNSVKMDKKEKVHPSYSTIIKQMNSKDAKVIKTFADDRIQTFRSLEALFKNFSSNELILSIDNLLRLRLIEEITYIANSNVLKLNDYARDSRTKNLAGYVSGGKIKTHTEGYQLTEYGKNFVEICCKE